MKKKLLIIIPSVIIVTLALVFVFFIYPKIIYNKDVSIIKNKISLVNDFLVNNKGDIKKIKEELKKEEVSSKRLEVEKETNSYLNNVLDDISELTDVINDKKVVNIFIDDKLKDNLDNDIKYLTEAKEKASTLKEKIVLLEKVDDKNIKDEDNKKLFNELFANNFKITNFDDKINEFNKVIDDNNSKLDYLKKNNKTWDIKEEKIVFNKRSNYNEYQKISNDENYELIKDDKGPVITASNLSITKGNKIDIKSKVKCEDAVDGKTECIVSGNYDINKVGNYDIKITSTDQSKNTSTKTIKLTVKEVVVNNKPYYIEVIRNQNVVIVYGLDNNNKYTKVVKVFICSVGKSSTPTPTGTFKTSDKSSWGWLVGNLYGQYYTRITGSILFHSVPYTKKAKNTLEWDEYNKLGTGASKGCIRMTVKDVKWIYDNCPKGTTVKIYDGNLPSGVSKPNAQKISADSPNKGWDPTDPDKNNPWKK